ncbi:DUF305 domain-containing protein [Streptomyces brevispora]|uniref:DUF305 domain-containing protein n=1 Tax=Streptomyces brevispora TaxID=887462 RepID=A0A561TXL9_9ACTN|nr:DUF305 domain-containing protein [Streptomyces brevispora]TWF91834.1 uncharacterized protein (DUF305 family) [Streptomyces brevispora]WSC17277.1 DUF305 domain-containing protein [Streptomyces brevispora]
MICRQVRRFRGFALIVVVSAAVLASAGCDGGGGANGSKDRAGGGGSVVAPGKPGEPARTLSASQAAKEAGVDTPNSADVRYVRLMIQHHAQALVLTQLVPSRSGSAAVKRIAERITAAQQPEIGAMRGWLSRHGRPEQADGHDHGAMPGMATAGQLKQLRAAKGTAFDQLFLKRMITHHQGAVTMATAVLSEGNNVQVEEMADDVIAQQTAEIGRMRALSS